MPHSADERRVVIPRRWLASSRVAVSVALIIALVGIALPYGAATPGIDGGLNPLEVVLSILAAAAAVGLAFDLLRPLHPRLHASGAAFAIAAGIWAAAAAYYLLISSRVGFVSALSDALRCLGWASLALYQWRVVALSPGAVDVEREAADG